MKSLPDMFGQALLAGVAPLALLALTPEAGAAQTAGYVTQTNIVSDGAVPATTIDHTFLNPWGIAAEPKGAFWISLNNWGTAPIYTAAGSLVFSVNVPAAPGQTGIGNPTGQVFNPTDGFVVTANKQSGAAAFIFDTENGTIAGWNGSVDPANAVTAVDNSKAGAIYKGLGLFTNKTGSYLLAANLASGLVEVYDSTFKLVGAFRDHSLPATLSPFNVQVIGKTIYVTYAQPNGSGDETLGAGLGMVETVDLYGTVSARVSGAAIDKLNAPWGLAIAPASWTGHAGDLLVGNFGDGTIHAFDAVTLAPTGALRDKTGAKIAIDGLWALTPGFGGGATAGGSRQEIYFTAGPNSQADGLFGSLTYTPPPAPPSPPSPPSPPGSPPSPPPPPPPPPPVGW